MVLFFLTQQGEFAKSLASLRSQQAQLQDDDLTAMHELAEM